MAVMNAVDTYFEWQGMGFRSLQNGHLNCDECVSAFWCNHIKMMITDNGDSENIFLAYQNDVNIEVPMFPSVNLWQTVILISHPKLKAFTVGIEVKDHTYWNGFINPGEGRNVLRSMVLDWFLGNVEVSNLTCKSSSHGLNAQLDWETSMRSNARSANHFCVWQTKSCLYCHSQANVGSDPDLVPDASDGSKKKPWEK